MENYKSELELLTLFEQHEKYIEATINKKFNSRSFWEHHGLTRDDIVQHGRIGLYEACKTYNPSQDTSFKSYAISRIYWSIRDESRRESLGRGSAWTFDLLDRTSFDIEVELESSEVYTLHDVLVDETNNHLKLEIRESLNKISNVISPRIAEIVSLKLQGYTNEQAGEKIGVSHQYISKLLRENKVEIKSILLAELS